MSRNFDRALFLLIMCVEFARASTTLLPPEQRESIDAFSLHISLLKPSNSQFPPHWPFPPRLVVSCFEHLKNKQIHPHPQTELIMVFGWLRHQMYTQPVVFWSWTFGIFGPASLVVMYPYRSSFEKVPAIPKSFPLPQRARLPTPGYDD